jgi:hypothetical protein
VLTPNDNKDRIYCALEPFGQNSGAPQYKAMCQGSPFPLAKTIWSTKLPLKIRIFTCQFAIDRLPSSETYQQEDHIFFNCVLAKFMWSDIREMFRVQGNPASFSQFTQILHNLHGKVRNIIWILFATQSSKLSSTINNLSIEASFPCQPADCFCKDNLFMQQWRPLLKQTEDM